MKILRGDWGQVSAVAYTPDGRHLASLHDDGLRFWGLASFRPALKVPIYATADPVLRFAGDRLVLPKGCWDISAVLRRLQRGKGRDKGLLQQVFLPQDVADYLWLAPSADGRAILGTGWRPFPGVAHLLRWSIDGELEHCVRLKRLLRPFLVASPDGMTLAGANDANVYLVDLESGQELAALAHEGHLGDLCFSPDGRLLAVAANRSVWLWDVAARKAITRFPAFRRKGPCVAFHPDGRLLGAGGPDGEVRLWDVEGPREVARLAPEIGPVHGLAFAPDGMTAAAGGEGAIAVWDVEP